MRYCPILILIDYKMEHQLFHGTWTAKLEAISANRTLFTATENIHYKNPIIRLIAYALMDLDTAMQTYQDDLGKELKRRQTASNPDFSDDQLHWSKTISQNTTNYKK